MSAENRKANRVCELKQITVLILIFLLSSVLAVVVDSDLSSAADGNETITADFTASPESGEAPLTVQFTDTSTGSPTERRWNFGDGSKLTEQNPIHTYEQAGSYTVTLTVRNSNGQDSKNVQINVIAAPETITADFTASPLSGEAPLTVQFTDTSTGSPTELEMEFWRRQ